MKDHVKRLINFRVDRFRELEIKLESLAAKGLVLEKCSTMLWTFRRTEPRKLTYTVTYFSEGSLFNPDLTENQQTYIDYAKAAGWDFVAEFNQMQVFCSEDENPTPFETDEGEKFSNIKKCMRKSFLPSIIVLLLVFSMNLAMSCSTLMRSPIDFLSNSISLNSVSVLLAVVLYYIYILIDYFVWCRRSAKSIAAGGSCFESTGNWRRTVDIVFLCCIFGAVGCFFLTLATDSKWFILIAGGLQMPIFMFIYWLAIHYMKKKKVDAMTNRIMSAVVLIVMTCCYMALIMWMIAGLGFGMDRGREYRTVNWELSPTESREYKLYNDPIPLTCEDLYGLTDYFYSYEAEVNNSIFLTRSIYRQDNLPGKNAPPRIEYEILEPKANFVYSLVRDELVSAPQWQETTTWDPIDNRFFGTLEAYQKHYDDEPTGQYILLMEDKLVTLFMEEPATPAQIEVIKEKLLQ